MVCKPVTMGQYPRLIYPQRELVLCNFLVVKQKLSAPFWKKKNNIYIHTYIYNSPSKALPSAKQIWRPSISTSVSCLFSCCLGRDVSLKLTSLSFDLCLNWSHYKNYVLQNQELPKTFLLKRMKSLNRLPFPVKKINQVSEKSSCCCQVTASVFCDVPLVSRRHQNFVPGRFWTSMAPEAILLGKHL